MKKCIAVLLCVCTLFSFDVTAFAAGSTEDNTAELKEEYGIPEPRYYEFETDIEYRAAYDAWLAGFSNFVLQKSEEEIRRAEEEAARQAEEEAARKEEEAKAASTPVESTPTKPTESAGDKHGNNGSAVDKVNSAEHPTGSYVDASGVVWAPDGTRLYESPAEVPAQGADSSEDNPLLPDVLADPNDLPALEDPDTLSVIAGLVSDIATDPPTWYVEDLRPVDPPVTVLDGLKALVTSIFGEYTPVTTTAVVSQTVGNDTHQYLVETVAPGAAGVDYEWVAGVFLFGIMLFCLMKLLGGVLK